VHIRRQRGQSGGAKHLSSTDRAGFRKGGGRPTCRESAKNDSRKIASQAVEYEASRMRTLKEAENIMKQSRLLYFILLGLFMAANPSQIVHADAGPHPSMQFLFVSGNKPGPAIVSGRLLECKDAACVESEPLRQLGPQQFKCRINACNSFAYSYGPYHRLIIEFSDGVTRQSNTFTKHAFAADYLVTIQELSLLVEEKPLGPNLPFETASPTVFDLLATVTFPCMEIILPILLLALVFRTGRAGATLHSYFYWLGAAWLLAIPATLAGIKWTQGLIITLVVELLLGTGYVLWSKRSAPVILTVIWLLNLITQPVLWITISGFSGLNSGFTIIFTEGVVWLVEAGGLYLSQRATMRFQEALWVSFILNTSSFVIGGLLPL
jgi:hypothetical protein